MAVLPRKSIADNPPRRWRSRKLVLGGGLIAALIAGWDVYSRAGPNNLLYASSPAEVSRTLAVMAADPSFWKVHVLASAQGLAVGWLLAVAAGLSLGVTMGWWHRVDETLEPLVFAFNSIPRIALIPIMMMWFGHGLTYKASVIALWCFFPVLLNTIAGIRQADPQLIKMAYSYGASGRFVLRTVALPDSVPYIFIGLRQSLTHAVTGIVGAELWASSAGLGWIISNAAMNIQVERIVAAVVIVAATGALLNELLQRLEATLTRWRRGDSR